MISKYPFFFMKDQHRLLLKIMLDQNLSYFLQNQFIAKFSYLELISLLVIMISKIIIMIKLTFNLILILY